MQVLCSRGHARRPSPRWGPSRLPQGGGRRGAPPPSRAGGGAGHLEELRSLSSAGREEGQRVGRRERRAVAVRLRCHAPAPTALLLRHGKEKRVEELAGAGKTPPAAQIDALEARPRGRRTWAAPPPEVEAEHEADTGVGGGSAVGGGAGAASGGDGGELRRGLVERGRRRRGGSGGRRRRDRWGGRRKRDSERGKTGRSFVLKRHRSTSASTSV